MVCIRFLLLLFFIFCTIGVYGSNVTFYSVKDTIKNDTLIKDTTKFDTLTVDTNKLEGIKLRKLEKKEEEPAKPTPSRSLIEKYMSDTIKYWKAGGFLTLNVSQVSLSNWSGGGENSLAANAILNLNANYARGNAAWDNILDFGFGRLKKERANAVKSDDKIELLTKYGRKISKKWFYSGSLNIKTQIFPGYAYPEDDSLKISDFFSPGYLFLSIGIDYKSKSNFTLLMSPVTGKTTILKSEKLSNNGAFGVDTGQHFRHEFGGYLKFVSKGSFLKIVNYQFKIDAFSNYMVKPENVDWDCELMVMAKLNKYITANFKLNVVYDDDIVSEPNIGPRIQHRQFIGLGFSYKF